MAKIYCLKIDNTGIACWALCYDNPKGVREVLTEDFKPLVFEKESEARAKLESIEAERRREDSAVAFSKAEAAEFAESQTWKFAKTYAKTCPHEYLVKNRLSDEDKLKYERFVQTMKADSVVGYFYGHENKYLILGDHYYWFMYTPDNMAVDLINRTTTDYLEERDGVYYYREKAK